MLQQRTGRLAERGHRGRLYPAGSAVDCGLMAQPSTISLVGGWNPQLLSRLSSHQQHDGRDPSRSAEREFENNQRNFAARRQPRELALQEVQLVQDQSEVIAGLISLPKRQPALRSSARRGSASIPVATDY